MNTIVKTACKMCYLDCGINVYLQDGRVTKIEGMREHPSNEGQLCPKGRAIIDYVYSSDRLKYPLKREGGKGEEKWMRVTWDDALTEVASKLHEIKEKYGAKSLAAYTGQGYGHYETKWFLQRFCDAYGTPNFAAVSSMCWCSPAHADLITYGSLLIPDIERSNCIVVLGANPSASDPVQAMRIAKAKRRGAKLIVVDPKRTPFAANADLLLQLKPGTDAALGLAMLNVIISEKLYDEKFVEKWMTGFTQLREHVKQYSPEAMGKVTWVPAETIRQAALMYAQNKPASVYKGNATALQVNGFQGYRAFMLLPALTGGVDVAGGCVIPMKVPLNNLRLPTTFEDKPVGAREHPLYVDQWREAQALLFSDAILTGKPYPIEAMIIAGANPALLWANSSKTRQALEALEFLVVIDTVMSETAKLADLVMPAGSFLERTELRDYEPTSVT